MKDDEIKFFKACYKHLTHIGNSQIVKGKYTARELIEILEDFIPSKRMWYYIHKWDSLGFYNYGVSPNVGWLEDDKIPLRYLELVQKENKKGE